VARELSHVGRQVFLNTLLMGLWLNFDRLTGLKMVSARELGYYTVAWNMAMIVERLVNRMSAVYFSMLAKTEDPEARRRWHQTMARRLTRFLIPMLALGAVVAPWGIRILFDARYIHAQAPMAILTGRLMLRALARVQTQYLLSIAKLYLETRAYAASFLAQLVLLWPMVKAFGVVGMALSSLITTFVLVAIQSLMLRLREGVSMAPLYRTTAWVLAALGGVWLLLR
jgi:O-antigen/teichoic acid export membrane protein